MYKHIYLPFEIKSRDLIGRVVLASYLAERDYKVIVFYKGHTEQVLKYYPKGIYFHHGIVRNYLNVIQKVKRLGHKVFAWDEEGFVFPSDDEHVNNRMDIKVYNELEKYFLWGEHQEKLLMRKTNDVSKTIKVGHPRLDLLRQEFRAYLSIDAEKIKEKYGKFILLNTKFNSNHFLGKQQAVNRLTKGDYFGGDNKFEQFHIDKMEYNNKNFDYYARLIPKLSKKFMDYNIIIRPHPSENFNTWERIYKNHNLNNVHVVHEGSVLQWLMAADIMIHNGCTTGVESFALGKPSILYKPVIDTRFDIYLIEKLSREINSEEDLLRLTENVLLDKDILFSKKEQHIKLKVLKKYLSNIDGKSASQEIYNEINNMDIDLCNNHYLSQFQFKMHMLYKSTKVAIRKVLPRRGLNKNNYNYLMHKLSKISLSELEEIVNNLNVTTSFFTNTRIKKISGSIYYFYKK